MKLPRIQDDNEDSEDEITLADVHKYFQGRVGVAIRELPPRLLLLPEVDLELELNPTPIDYALRRRFYDVIETAKRTKPKYISVPRLCEGICTRTYFEEHFIQNPTKVAWLIRPPVPHEALYEALNKLVLGKLLEYTAANKISEKNLSAIIKLAEMSANRAYGAVVQKIQTKNLNLEARVADPSLPPSQDATQLEARARELQAKLVEGAIDVTPGPEEN